LATKGNFKLCPTHDNRKTKQNSDQKITKVGILFSQQALRLNVFRD